MIQVFNTQLCFAVFCYGCYSCYSACDDTGVRRLCFTVFFFVAAKAAIALLVRIRVLDNCVLLLFVAAKAATGLLVRIRVLDDCWIPGD